MSAAATAATLWSTLAEPWRAELMRHALAEVVLLGVVGGALGCWIVFYELPYATESLAHGLFPGLVAAVLLGLPLVLGGLVGLLVAALAIALAARLPAIGRDTAIAVVVTTLFGLGALLALAPQSPPGIEGLLFGDVLALSRGDLALAAGLAALVLAALAVLHARLLAVGFDRAGAPALGLGAGAVDAALLVLVALALLVAVQGLGNLLVVALLVAPAATARRLTRRMPAMMALAAALAVLGGVGGLELSYYAGTAAGASIAGILVVTHLAVVLGARLWAAARSGGAAADAARAGAAPAGSAS